ncbi:MAG: hypothetical protein CMD16_03335 [Flavobacteriales bacterium]|nr:hypothetical protein [Flavobacteriales bacterium]|tara:strand:- start:12860 stop:13582 length:723 start_codon:yes stop_codon:yes gene_type:complete
MNNSFSIVLLLLIFSSCGIKKEKKNDFSSPPKNSKELIARVNSQNKDIQWLNLKGKINIITEDNQIALNINITNRKDSLIWISVSAPFGIEIARGQLTQDSIYFINRTNKTWFIKPASEINSLLKANLSFNQLQQMITANPSINKLKYKFHSKEQFILEEPNSNYTISESYRVVKGVLFIEGTKFQYEFLNFNEENFPREVYLKTDSKKGFEVRLRYSKIIANKKSKTPFKIPISYAHSN